MTGSIPRTSPSQRRTAVLGLSLLLALSANSANADLVKRLQHHNHNHQELLHRAPTLVPRSEPTPILAYPRSYQPGSDLAPEKRLGGLLNGLLTGLGGGPKTTAAPAPQHTPIRPNPPSQPGGSTGGGGNTGGGGSTGGGSTGGGGTTNPDTGTGTDPGTGTGTGNTGGNTGGAGSGTGTTPSTGTGSGVDAGSNGGTGEIPTTPTEPNADGSNGGTLDTSSGTNAGTGTGTGGGTKGEVGNGGNGQTGAGNGNNGGTKGTGSTSASGNSGSNGVSTVDSDGDGYSDSGTYIGTSSNTGSGSGGHHGTNGNSGSGKSGSSGAKVVVPILVTLIVLALVVGVASWLWKRHTRAQDAKDRESFSWVRKSRAVSTSPNHAEKRDSGESFAGVVRPASQLSFASPQVPMEVHYPHPAVAEFGHIHQDMVNVNGWPAVSGQQQRYRNNSLHSTHHTHTTHHTNGPTSDDAQHLEDDRPGSGLYPFSPGSHEYNPRSDDGSAAALSVYPGMIYGSYSEHDHSSSHYRSTTDHTHVQDSDAIEGEEAISPFADYPSSSNLTVNGSGGHGKLEDQPRRSREQPAYSLDPHISQLERLSGSMMPAYGSIKKDQPPPPSLMPGSPSGPVLVSSRSGSSVGSDDRSAVSSLKSARKPVPTVGATGVRGRGSLNDEMGSTTGSYVSGISGYTGYTMATEEVMMDGEETFVLGRDLLEVNNNNNDNEASQQSSRQNSRDIIEGASGFPQVPSNRPDQRDSVATITMANSLSRTNDSGRTESDPFADSNTNNNYHAAAAAAATAQAQAKAAARNTSVSTATTTTGSYDSDEALSIRMSHFQNVDPFSPGGNGGAGGDGFTSDPRAISPMTGRRATQSSFAQSDIIKE
ncbi:unnamed protein product [Tilletia controversa]|nr:unnamed protein product [Tilletia controversa]